MSAAHRFGLWVGAEQTASEARAAREGVSPAAAPTRLRSSAAIDSERLRQWAAEWAPKRELYRRILEHDAEAMEELSLVLAEEHSIRLIISRNISGAAAFARELPGGRWEITVQPLLDGGLTREQIAQRFADTLHEFGHGLAGPCTGPLHYVDPSRRDGRICARGVSG
jgi:hypothetical protein